MVKQPAYIEHGDIATKPVQMYGWDGEKPVRIGATENALPASEDTLISLKEAIQNVVQYLSAIASARGVVSDIRVTVLSNPTTAVTISSGTVTQVTTVAGITNIGGLSAYPAQVANMNMTAVLSNIQNVVV